MNLRSLPLCGAALALALCACSSPTPDANSTATTPATPAAAAPAAMPPDLMATPSADAIQPVEVKADAIAVGSALGPNQAVTASKPAYATGDTIYVSMPTKGQPAGGKAHVYWTSAQTGRSLKEEDKSVSGDFVNFQLPASDMKPGNYNVEIDVNDRPVGIADFKIQ